MGKQSVQTTLEVTLMFVFRTRVFNLDGRRKPAQKIRCILWKLSTHSSRRRTAAAQRHELPAQSPSGRRHTGTVELTNSQSASSWRERALQCR
jgi:hypothetical protein